MTVQRKLRFAAFVLCFTGLFVAGLFVAHRAFVASWNEKQLRQLATDTIARTELAIDSATMKMSDVIVNRGTSCATVERMAMTRALYGSSIMKNMRLETENGVCWSYEEKKQALEQSIATAQQNRTKSPGYSLSSLRFPGWKGLGVRWQYGENENIVEVLATSGLLFAILPAELRDSALIQLTLADGTSFASYSPQKKWLTDGTKLTMFEEKSTQYPIAFSLKVDQAALARWNQALSPQTIAITLAFGLGFGILAARGMFRNTSILDELDTALSGGRIQPYFQPIFDLEDRKLLGFEMLARWIKPDGSMIPPLAFIPLAESSGRIERLTTELLKQAGAQLGGLLQAQNHLKLTFNVTPDQYLADGFVDNLILDATRFNLPHRALVVEVTERQVITDKARAATVTANLIDAGLRVAIDDAGTGHNGLSAIHALGANYLKIDKFFVDGITLDRKSSELVEMLASLATKFGMIVVAEGIETEEQIAALLQMGIREGQGFVYSRPVPAAAILAMATKDAAAATPKRGTGRASLLLSA
ncbi:EAL domain-containing protein [Rhizobium herbae]|uniref:Sensor c-di-GMP phosphodiesterase-like protein n=1 Tax=Rhizobium herbae TaxID=508661 RepID=A0ABS4ELS3_9HYPH|nr:EAL domain-containing protein [Rhizobium herbae]MBP1858898.1 sensor c-di-GMP phosphodiesterase-like protein [Rhizobium herbae]